MSTLVTLGDQGFLEGGKLPTRVEERQEADDCAMHSPP